MAKKESKTVNGVFTRELDEGKDWEYLYPLEMLGEEYSPSERIRQWYSWLEITTNDLEIFCKISYAVGSNPLPILRKAMGGVEICFCYEGSHLPNSGEASIDVYLDSDTGEVRIDSPVSGKLSIAHALDIERAWNRVIEKGTDYEYLSCAILDEVALPDSNITALIGEYLDIQW